MSDNLVSIEGARPDADAAGRPHGCRYREATASELVDYVVGHLEELATPQV
jgi:hypothetical protein